MSPSNAGRKLHVLTLTPFFPSQENEVGGCFVAEPVRQLAQFGVESSVIAVSPLHHAPKHASSSDPAEWLRYPTVPGNFGLASAGTFLAFRLHQRVGKLHAEKRIDLIHAHAALPCGQAAALLSQRLNVPFVVSVHGLDAFNTCYAEGRLADWRRRASEAVYRAARTVICVSGKVQLIVQSGTPPETCSTVVYNGVDPDRFSPKIGSATESNSEILIVGNLLRSKGHALLLRSLGNLAEAFPLLRCRVIGVGEGSAQSHLEALVRELGIGDRVQFDGRKSRSDVATAMRRCTVFVLPSSNEGLGCVYLEAMSCGKPAIGCSGQGIDEVIKHGENGWLIPVDGLEELEQGLSQLLTTPELRTRIGTAARRTILEQFTLSYQAERFAAIYRQAISQG